MRRCSLMLVLFIVVVLAASHFMKDEENLNESITVAVEVQEHKIIRR
ncbi:hypothetical protein [Maribacter sp. Asnod1-A12]